MSELYNIYNCIINSRLSMQDRIDAMTKLYNSHLPFRLDERMPEYMTESIIATAFIAFYKRVEYFRGNQKMRELNILARILIGLSHYYLPSCRFSTPVSDLEMLENVGIQMEFESREFYTAFLFVKRILIS